MLTPRKIDYDSGEFKHNSLHTNAWVEVRFYLVQGAVEAYLMAVFIAVKEWLLSRAVCVRDPKVLLFLWGTLQSNRHV